ncbi:MAG: branched-chain amino acid ABC transporter permease [Dehalococcoidales bacterium]|nr:branched-chain amino acid ABC transporter permease [Dehalococcoidales bacterium]
MDFSVALQIFISGLNLGCIYAALGLGFFVIYNVTRVLNLAQGEFVMLGGMLTVSFYTMGIPLFPSILLAVVITALAGAGLYRFIIYPARKSSGMTKVFLTLGFAFIIEGIALRVWGWEFRSLPAFFNTSSIQLWEATIFGQTPWVIGITLLMVIGLFFFFGHTIQGKAMRACANEPLGARMMGISIERMALFSFVLAAGLGAIVGALITPLTMTSYSIGLPLTAKGVLAAFVGGITRVEGVILGGLVYGMIEAITAGVIPGGYHSVIALAILVSVLLCRRRGILLTAGQG